MNAVTLKYLRKLLKEEEERLDNLRKRKTTYQALLIARAYQLGRVEGYKDLVGFLTKTEG